MTPIDAKGMKKQSHARVFRISEGEEKKVAAIVAVDMSRDRCG